MSDIKWIKISVDIFENRKIKYIKHMKKIKNPSKIILIWIELLALAGKENNDGHFKITDNIPYSDEMFAEFLGEDVKDIKQAFEIFESLKMIKNNDGFIEICNWEEYQNTDGMAKIREQTRKRVAKYRNSQKDGQCQNNVTCDEIIDDESEIKNDTSNVTVTQCNDSTCNDTSNVTVTQCNATDKIRIDKNKNIYSVCNNDDIYSPALQSLLHTDTHTPIELSSKQINETCDLYESLCKQYGTAFVSERIHRARQYKNTDNMETVAKWCREDWQKKVRQGNGKVNNFNRFDSKSDYDMDELESKLLSN